MFVQGSAATIPLKFNGHKFNHLQLIFNSQNDKWDLMTF